VCVFLFLGIVFFEILFFLLCVCVCVCVCVSVCVVCVCLVFYVLCAVFGVFSHQPPIPTYPQIQTCMTFVLFLGAGVLDVTSLKPLQVRA
jgi:hypothetical protein